jgi:hypothetical protein
MLEHLVGNLLPKPLCNHGPGTRHDRLAPGNAVRVTGKETRPALTQDSFGQLPGCGSESASELIRSELERATEIGKALDNIEMPARP